MGLFSKKQAVCKGCGKEFVYRSKTLFDGFCNECQMKRLDEKKQLEEVAAGYVFYNTSYLWNSNLSNEDLVKYFLAFKIHILLIPDFKLIFELSNLLISGKIVNSLSLI